MPVLGSRVFFAAGLLLASATTATADEAISPDDGHALTLGGALRFSYGWLDYADSPGFDLELLRVDAKGHAGRAFFSLQYRWYDGFDALHHAWAGWRIDAESDIRIGVQQVPFGLLPYASQSFWFGAGYYLGLEDDYDLGVVWQRGDERHQWHAALFAGDEYRSGHRPDRYSFDVATTDAHPYREGERLHLRYAHNRAAGPGTLSLGASLFSGRIENRLDGGHYRHHGAALHAQWTHAGWTAQAQWARYRYAVPGPRLSLSAFGFPFEIAAEADVPTLNLARTLPRSGWFDSITCYNNLSLARPVGGHPALASAWQNVTGCSFGKGAMLTYVDWIAGRNMWFIGGPGVGIDDPAGKHWRSRLNVNVGFYF